MIETFKKSLSCFLLALFCVSFCCLSTAYAQPTTDTSMIEAVNQKIVERLIGSDEVDGEEKILYGSLHANSMNEKLVDDVNRVSADSIERSRWEAEQAIIAAREEAERARLEAIEAAERAKHPHFYSLHRYNDDYAHEDGSMNE